MTPTSMIDPVALGMTADGIVRLCDQEIARAEALAKELRGLKEMADEALTIQTTLGVFDEMIFAVQNAMCFAQLMSMAHPDEAVRVAAQTCEPKGSAFLTALYLDQEIATGFIRVGALFKDTDLYTGE